MSIEKEASAFDPERDPSPMQSLVAEDGVVRRKWPDLETRYARLLEYTFAKAREESRLANIVVVGAMDGRRFDALYPYLSKGLARAILIEPIPDRFALLQETFADQSTLIFENCAIDAQRGTREMLYVPIDAVERQGLSEDVIGMSSFYDDRNGLGRGDEAVEAHIERAEVRTCPLSDIVRQHGFDAIDILQTDTEGHDLHVLKSLDMSVVRPDTIFMEYYNMPQSERLELVHLFESQGYIYGNARKDICATLHRLPPKHESRIATRLRRLKRSVTKRLRRLTG